MSGFGYSRQVVVFDSASANSAVTISKPFLVQDAYKLSASLTTVAAAASVISVQMSNDNGLTDTPTFSTFTSIAAAGGGGSLFLPGALGIGIPRWIRFVRATADSTASMTMSYTVS